VRASVATVLIVDADLGFVFWLGRLLADAGFDSIPARNPDDACELLQKMQVRADVLIIDPCCPGAASLIAALRDREQTAVIGLAPRDQPRRELPEGMARWAEKPVQPDEVSGMEWVKAVTDVVTKVKTA
jgi:DNA-binding response OmpR family regulator